MTELSPHHFADEIIAVPAIPRTLNGKKLEIPVKRILTGTPIEEALSLAAVADPAALEPFASLASRPRDAVDSEIQPPRTETERQLAEMWAALLGAETVGALDYFVGVGGDSLRAGRLSYLIQESFAVDLPLATILISNLRELATEIDTGRASDGGNYAGAWQFIRPGRTQLHLSFAQEDFWHRQREQPRNPFLNISGAERVGGPLDLDAFQRAAALVADRHQILRTVFRSRRGQPAPELADSAPHVGVEDLTSLPFERREDQARRVVSYLIRQPFDLESVPLIRVDLVRITATDHVIVLTSHLLVCDGPARFVWLKEVQSAYEALRAGRAPALEPLPIQFTDYAAWLRETRGGTSSADLAYWESCLAGRRFTLPVDHRPAAPFTYPLGVMTTLIPAEEASVLRDLAVRHRSTLFMSCAAAWSTALAEWADSPDTILGTYWHGRFSPDLARLVGYFTNLFTLHRSTRERSLDVNLTSLRATAIESYSHQHVPYELLAERLGLTPATASDPFVQAVLVVSDRSRPVPAAWQLPTESYPLELCTARFFLTIMVMDVGHDIWVRLEYRADLFERATLARLVAGFRSLLRPGVTPSSAVELTASDATRAPSHLRNWILQTHGNPGASR